MIALMMETVCTSETSAHFKVTTWRYIPEDSKLTTAVFAKMLDNFQHLIQLIPES
jgi:hypothetical protein